MILHKGNKLAGFGMVAAVVLIMSAAPLSAEGDLFLIGGGEEPRALINAFISSAGGKDASILIIASASSLPAAGDNYLQWFTTSFGCTNVSILPVTLRADAEREANAALISAADGIFITGGDQQRLITIFKGSRCLTALQERFAAGAAVAGTSAGAMVLGEEVLTGDGRFDVIRKGAAEIKPGFKLIRKYVIDSHFVERSRQNRLLSTILQRRPLIGLGIDSGTGLWIRSNGRAVVIGRYWVVLYQLDQATITSRQSGSDDNRGGYSILTHILQNGDSFDISTLEIHRGRQQKIIAEPR